MFILYIIGIVIHGVISVTPCTDGVKIVTQETKNPEDLLGNWTYAYLWDPKVKSEKNFIDNSGFECPQLHFELATPQFRKAKEAECKKILDSLTSYKRYLFNWDDVKLRVDSPTLKIEGAMVIIGEKGNWMAQDCLTMTKLVIKKLSDNYIAMSYSHPPSRPGNNDETELLVREFPTLDELKCVVHNVDVRQDMLGIGLC